MGSHLGGHVGAGGQQVRQQLGKQGRQRGRALAGERAEPRQRGLVVRQAVAADVPRQRPHHLFHPMSAPCIQLAVLPTACMCPPHAPCRAPGCRR